MALGMVLILVLMEYGLGVGVRDDFEFINDQVLILVLMEYGLGDSLIAIFWTIVAGLS